jgi:hypothetical protein
MHQVAAALVEGQKTIRAKEFDKTPPPDFADVHPDE